jgi:hypothetical protein
MTPTQYASLRTQAIEYFNSLDIEAVREEFSNSFLLNRNAKLEKGDGIAIFGLELTPSKFCQTEVNMCGNEGECLFTCLVFSGAGNLTRAGSKDSDPILTPVLKKRIRRTFLFLKDREFCVNRIKGEVALQRFTFGKVALRLNVFSDWKWEDELDLDSLGVTLYDYSKKKSDFEGTKRHLTYSASEKDSDQDLVALLEKGYNVAMVFHANKLPETWNGFTVVNGDKDDRRFNDPKGVVVGLTQKTTIGGKNKSKFTDRTVA